MISPTGKPVRPTDAHGSGTYGAGRGRRRHRGADYICEPGQPVFAPIDGTVAREARPYEAEKYGGVVIQGQHMTIMMFYLELDPYLISQSVKQGDVIGKAQDIGEKYPGIIPHVHLQIENINPAIFTEML